MRIASPDWRPDGEQGVWIRGETSQWYYARTQTACPRLRTAVTLGFRTAGIDELDNNGAIIAERSICPIASLTRSDGPPPKRG